MNMQFRLMVTGILILFVLILASIPTSVVYSQTGGGYTCGVFQWLDAGSRGFPAFVPAGSENNPSAWWVIDTLDGNLLVETTGEEIDPIANYGRSIWIWYPSFSSSGTSLESIGSYQWVSSCSPVVNATNTPLPTIVPLSINFWADSTTIMAGQCTNLNWSVTGSGITGVYIGNQPFPPISNVNICLSSGTTYTLIVNSSQGNRSSDVTINVVYPTNTPIPATSTRIPPTRTPISPSATPVPTTRPSATTVPAPLLPPDGPRSNSGFWCFLPGFCVQAAEVNTTCHPQCVETASRLRSDLSTWGAVMTSDQILALAESKPIFKFQNEMQQVRVRDINEAPQSGDLLIWPHDCDYAWSGGGHIGYVTNGDPFRITDTNWDGACGERTNKHIDIKSCMRFITSPYPINSSNGTLSLTPAVIPTPIPGIVPTPAGQPSNLFQWIIDFFK